MSDLTRRVLEADQYIENDIQDVDWNKFDDARRTLENAAPTLARQVEAVERRCAAMEPEGQPLAYAAALIRDALNSVD